VLEAGNVCWLTPVKTPFSYQLYVYFQGNSLPITVQYKLSLSVGEFGVTSTTPLGIVVVVSGGIVVSSQSVQTLALAPEL
jgi:hypothetical protein